MTEKTKKKMGLVYLTGILLLIGYILGFTVRPSVWNTQNVVGTGMPVFIGCGAAALVGVIAYRLLAGKVLSLVLLLLCLATGACAMFAMTAMWYDCVVEVAYIYGEGNLEIGNQAAVNGSILALVSSVAYLLSAVTTVCLSAKK